MLFCSLTSLDLRENCSHLDGVELRLDQFAQINLTRLKKFIQHSSLPVLLTPRSLERDLVFLEKLFALQPAYIDVGYDLDKQFLEKMNRSYPEVKIIASFHDFEGKERDFKALLESMVDPLFYGYKIAVKVDSSLDALRLLDFTKEHNSDEFRLSMTAMGERGEWSRILGPLFNNWINYTFLDVPLAPGQVSYDDLCTVYHYPDLNSETRIYALIGYPVVKSRGHLFHNRFFNQGEVYVKIPLERGELEQGIEWIRSHIQGLSVTMPLKEEIIPYLDGLDPLSEEIGAVNTVINHQGTLWGFNTDGPGAIASIEEHRDLTGEKVVILGSGGVAKAIAYCAHRKGAEVTILSRDLKKGELIAKKVDGRSGPIDMIGAIDHSIVINCTPHSMPIDPAAISATSLVMDTDVGLEVQEGSFLFETHKRGCPIVLGSTMFEKQAYLQQKIWQGQHEAVYG